MNGSHPIHWSHPRDISNILADDRENGVRVSSCLLSNLTSAVLLGPTSTWSFSRRVLSIIQDRLHPGRSSPIPLAVDGDAYQLHWSHASSEEPPDISGLPS